MPRLALFLAAAAVSVAHVGVAQTVRFTTSVGAFDMALNPTGDPNLQPLVDNMLANVGAGVYHDVWVNRADPGFVLQLGSFTIDSTDVDDLARGFESAESFAPITVDSNGDPTDGLDFAAMSNTRGTVSLALSAGNPNSGSASFFVNVGDSSFLDAQGFVPFAFVDDMTVIDQIMTGPRMDLGPQLGQGAGNLAFANVPMTSDGGLILIETAAVISDEPFSFVDPLLSAVNTAVTEAEASAFDSALSDAAAEAVTDVDDIFTEAIEAGIIDSAAASVATATPEPGSALLAAFAAAMAAFRRQR